MLHLLMHSPWQCDIATMMQLLKKGDDLLLLQDGVIAAIRNNPVLEKLLATSAVLYVLNEDVLARGITADISTEVNMIDYHEFVKLTEKHHHQITW